ESRSRAGPQPGRFDPAPPAGPRRADRLPRAARRHRTPAGPRPRARHGHRPLGRTDRPVPGLVAVRPRLPAAGGLPGRRAALGRRNRAGPLAFAVRAGRPVLVHPGLGQSRPFLPLRSPPRPRPGPLGQRHGLGGRRLLAHLPPGPRPPPVEVDPGVPAAPPARVAGGPPPRPAPPRGGAGGAARPPPPRPTPPP